MKKISKDHFKYFFSWKKFTDRESPTLFLGIDVTHPPPSDLSPPSIAAIVGSLNISATRFGIYLSKSWLINIRLNIRVLQQFLY